MMAKNEREKGIWMSKLGSQPVNFCLQKIPFRLRHTHTQYWQYKCLYIPACLRLCTCIYMNTCVQLFCFWGGFFALVIFTLPYCTRLSYVQGLFTLHTSSGTFRQLTLIRGKKERKTSFSFPFKVWIFKVGNSSNKQLHFNVSSSDTTSKNDRSEAQHC